MSFKSSTTLWVGYLAVAVATAVAYVLKHELKMHDLLVGIYALVAGMLTIHLMRKYLK